MSSSIKFKWDENKRRGNIKKHGIGFVDAIEVFSDPSAYTGLSPRTISEHRYVMVGLMKGALVAVIFTLRGDATRIISARPARRTERNTYGAEGTKESS